MKKIKEVIIVEGRYDKNAISQVVDTLILETSGFGIFSDREKLALIRKLAQVRGIIVFTDSDSAGFMIRNFLKGSIPNEMIKHAYIPDIRGKERRKRAASKEGKLGVEGMDSETLLAALRKAGATFENMKKNELGKLTLQDMFFEGFSGGKNSSGRRKKLLKKLELPERLSTTALVDIMNSLYSREESIHILRGVE